MESKRRTQQTKPDPMIWRRVRARDSWSRQLRTSSNFPNTSSFSSFFSDGLPSRKLSPVADSPEGVILVCYRAILGIKQRVCPAPSYIVDETIGSLYRREFKMKMSVEFENKRVETDFQEDWQSLIPLHGHRHH